MRTAAAPSDSPSGEVRLRDVVEADLPILYEQQLDPEATRMAAFPSREHDAFMAHWAKILADETLIAKAILFGGHVAGNIGSFELDGLRYVGYWLGKEYWGKGIATRALAELLTIVDQRPLYATVARHNIGSRRVLEKCGFTIHAEHPDPLGAPGDMLDEYLLTLDTHAGGETI